MVTMVTETRLILYKISTDIEAVLLIRSAHQSTIRAVYSDQHNMNYFSTIGTHTNEVYMPSKVSAPAWTASTSTAYRCGVQDKKLIVLCEMCRSIKDMDHHGPPCHE